MENEIKENIIKDLLYEHSSRKILVAKAKQNKTKIFVLRAVAAGLITVMTLVGTQYYLNKAVDRNDLVASLYKFPNISKSRSADFSQVDRYITELNNKEYQLVLQNLYNDSLSEKDLFVKTNLFYQLDSLENVKQIIESYKFDDPYNKDQIGWLDFLVSYKSGENKGNLKIKLDGLSKDYQPKAKILLDKI